MTPPVKSVIFNLKREWYDKIASGEKTVEYRAQTGYWYKRLWFGSDLPGIVYSRIDGSISPNENVEWLAVFRLGYSRNHPDIVRRIVKIDIGPCPYDGWDGEYFRVHFDRENCQ